MNVSERWSRYKYRGRNAPKGSQDAFESAKAILAPFKSEHNPSTSALFCACEKCMEQNIRHVATAFNARALIIQGAPRKRIVVDNLQRLREGAKSFADLLVALDDYSRNELLTPFECLGPADPSAQLYEAARIVNLPTPETRDGAASDGVLVERLRALEQYVDLCITAFTAADGEGAPVDRGGNTNLLKKQYGPPTKYMVARCWYFFEMCRPGEATASETGPFLAFVNSVYEYATGELEENATLLNWAKKLARPLRHQFENRKQQAACEIELDRLKRDPQTPERDARVTVLKAEVAALTEDFFKTLF